MGFLPRNCHSNPARKLKKQALLYFDRLYSNPSLSNLASKQMLKCLPIVSYLTIMALINPEQTAT